MMAADALEFWFEFGSTYSYPAAARVEQLASAAGVPLAWKPFLLGPIFRAQGWNDSPFNIYPAKGRYMWRDLERVCAKHGLPLRRPTVFPRSGLLAARVACIASAEGWCGPFARAVYAANFAEDLDIADAGVVGGVIEALGRPARAVLERAQTADVKDELRRQTEAATALGIFGAPTCVARGDLFWGNDRLEDALLAMARPAAG
jgi:2-hydroxychromene-2-carboxylate isomerase